MLSPRGGGAAAKSANASSMGPGNYTHPPGSGRRGAVFRPGARESDDSRTATTPQVGPPFNRECPIPRRTSPAVAGPAALSGRGAAAPPPLAPAPEDHAAAPV